MQLPKSQHKVILLFARLMELKTTKAPIAGGYITLSDNSEKDFVLRTPSGDQKLAGFKEMERHRAVRKPQPGKNLDNLDKIVLQLFPGRWSDRYPVSSDKILLSEFSQGIGIDRARSRYIIDYIHASELPTFSSVTQKATTAHRFAERHGGLYFVYRHDENDATRSNPSQRGAIVRSTLSIRYPVPYKPHASERKGESRIRCKLTIPGYGRQWKGGHILYDGYVGTKGPWHQFLLQARRDSAVTTKRPGDDLILMYTEALGTETSGPTTFTHGVMLTQNQEVNMTPTVSSVVIERQPNFRVKRQEIKELEKLDAYEYLRTFYKLEPSDESSFMNANAKVFSPQDAEVSRAVVALFEGWGRLNTLGLHR